MFRRFARPLSRLLLRTVSIDDPWRRYAHPVPLHRYGAGSLRDFQWYFEQESSVAVHSVHDVLAWLEGCTYARDPELFNEPDFWQHPVTFEQLRQGDCEDFALWAWRKLVRLGHPAEFVAGQSLACPAGASGHAWVCVELDGRSFILDAVAACGREALRPLKSVRDEYLPEVSVDGAFRRFAFGGYYQQLRAGQCGNMPATPVLRPSV